MCSFGQFRIETRYFFSKVVCILQASQVNVEKAFPTFPAFHMSGVAIQNSDEESYPGGDTESPLFPWRRSGFRLSCDPTRDEGVPRARTSCHDCTGRDNLSGSLWGHPWETVNPD